MVTGSKQVKIILKMKFYAHLVRRKLEFTNLFKKLKKVFFLTEEIQDCLLNLILIGNRMFNNQRKQSISFSSN